MEKLYTIGYTLLEDAYGAEKDSRGVCLYNGAEPFCVTDKYLLVPFIQPLNDEFPEADHYICELVRVADA